MENFLAAKKQFEYKIEHLKTGLIETGLKLGLNDHNTIQLSQELDTLIFEYQRLISMIKAKYNDSLNGKT